MFEHITKNFKLKNILFQFLIMLGIYSFFAILNSINFNAENFWSYSSNTTFYKTLISLFSIAAASYLIYALDYYYGERKINYLNLAISGLILFLVLHPTVNSFFVFPIITLIALGTKKYIRYKGKPIFNPAAFGLFLFLIFTIIMQHLRFVDDKLFISWWGASFQKPMSIGAIPIPISSLMFAPVFAYYAYMFRRHLYGFAFLITLIFIQIGVYTIGTGNLGQGFNEIWNFSRLSTWAFFIFVMLIEPKTSPVFKNQQIYLGILGAVIYLPLAKLTSFPAPEILTILIMNVVTLNADALFKR